MTSVASAAPLENVHKMIRNRKPKSEKEIAYQVEAGSQLTKARMANDLEVEQMAEFLKSTFVGDVGFNRTSLYKHEKGDRTLTPYRLKCIADALDIPVTELFDKTARYREVIKLHSKNEIHAPYTLKKINSGDALITEALGFENEAITFEGYYVFIDKDDKLKLCYIMPSDNNTQYAVECDEGLKVFSFDTFFSHIAKYKSFKKVTYVISKVAL